MLPLNSGALGIGVASELINAESAEIGLTIRKPFTVSASGTASHQGCVQRPGFLLRLAGDAGCTRASFSSSIGYSHLSTRSLQGHSASL